MSGGRALPVSAIAARSRRCAGETESLQTFLELAAEGLTPADDIRRGHHAFRPDHRSSATHPTPVMGGLPASSSTLSREAVQCIPHCVAALVRLRWRAIDVRRVPSLSTRPTAIFVPPISMARISLSASGSTAVLYGHGRIPPRCAGSKHVGAIRLDLAITEWSSAWWVHPRTGPLRLRHEDDHNNPGIIA